MKNKLLAKELSTSPLIRSKVLIPAYDQNHNDFLLPVTLEVNLQKSFQIDTEGSASLDVRKVLNSVISVMSRLNSNWKKRLNKISYTIISDNETLCSINTKNAGMPLCIALLNVLKQLNEEHTYSSVLSERYCVQENNTM